MNAETELKRFKIFTIIMCMEGFIGISEFILSILSHTYNYFYMIYLIFSVAILAVSITYYKVGKEKIKEKLGKISENQYLKIRNMQLKYFSIPVILYVLLIAIVAIILKNYMILIIGYIIGIIVFILIEKHLLDMQKNI